MVQHTMGPELVEVSLHKGMSIGTTEDPRPLAHGRLKGRGMSIGTTEHPRWHMGVSEGKACQLAGHCHNNRVPAPAHLTLHGVLPFRFKFVECTELVQPSLDGAMPRRAPHHKHDLLEAPHGNLRLSKGGSGVGGVSTCHDEDNFARSLFLVAAPCPP